MAGFTDNFSRYEFKFPMRYREMDRFIGEILPYVHLDEHAGPGGIYTISSIYMDNDQLQCYYETINNDYFRQKVRLRVYGNNNDENATAFLEIKGKIDGLVVKRRVKMVLRDAMAFIKACNEKGYDFDITEYKSTNTQILKELRRVIVSKNLKNANVVSYDRIPYVCTADPDLRITFDFNIRTRGEELDLTKGTYGEYRCPRDVAILEVKTSKEIPMWLVKILANYGYRNQTFSKYCSHYSPMNIMLAPEKEEDKNNKEGFKYVSGIFDINN